MSAPRPLDPSIGSVFRVAAALATGQGRERMRRSDLLAPHHGVRRRVGSAPEDRLRALRDYAPLLRPGDRFSHVTAALLWDVPLPAGIDPALHVSAASGGQPRTHGIVGHRVHDGERVLRRGLPASTPESLFLELAPLLSTDDLVAVGDHLVLDPFVLDPADLRPWTTPERLVDAAARSSRRGVRRARVAAAQVRIGAESRPESLLRLTLMRAGLPEPRLNVPIADRRGRPIGRFDLVWPERRVAVEYDGDQHRTSRAQYEKDQRRMDAAADGGWRVVRVRARGLGAGRDDTIARVTRALSRP
jgi:very-short-patch-repair endonuclease